MKNDTLKDKDKKSKDGKDKDKDKDAKPAEDKGTPQADAGKDGKPADGDKQAAENPLDAFTHFGDPAVDYQLSRAIDLMHGLSLYKSTAAKTN